LLRLVVDAENGLPLLFGGHAFRSCHDDILTRTQAHRQLNAKEMMD
jgi:hypothetical protein